MNSQIAVNTGVGIAGAFITFAFGRWTEALTFLLCVIAVDIISGISASIKEGRGLSSAVGAVGLAKKGLMLLVIILAHRVDILLELDGVTMGAATYFYIANEMIRWLKITGGTAYRYRTRLNALSPYSKIKVA